MLLTFLFIGSTVTPLLKNPAQLPGSHHTRVSSGRAAPCLTGLISCPEKPLDQQGRPLRLPHPRLLPATPVSLLFSLQLTQSHREARFQSQLSC